MVQQQVDKNGSDESFGIVPLHGNDGEFLFLLIQQKEGAWGFPKGHPKNNENELETARRELLEETKIIDIQIIEGPFFIERYEAEHDGITVDKTVKYFLARVPETKVTIDHSEIIGYGWFTYEESLDLVKYESRKNIIREAKEYADKHFEKTL